MFSYFLDNVRYGGIANGFDDYLSYSDADQNGEARYPLKIIADCVRRARNNNRLQSLEDHAVAWYNGLATLYQISPQRIVPYAYMKMIMDLSVDITLYLMQNHQRLADSGILEPVDDDFFFVLRIVQQLIDPLQFQVYMQ